MRPSLKIGAANNFGRDANAPQNCPAYLTCKGLAAKPGRLRLFAAQSTDVASTIPALPYTSSGETARRMGHQERRGFALQ